MVRLLAFALHSDEALEFGRGLSAEGEPDLVRRDATGAVDLWIEVGLPDERDVRKACGRAREVAVFAYGARKVEKWWSDNAAAFARQSNLRVLTLTGEETAALQTLAARSMSLTAPCRNSMCGSHRPHPPSSSPRPAERRGRSS